MTDNGWDFVDNSSPEERHIRVNEPISNIGWQDGIPSVTSSGSYPGVTINWGNTEQTGSITYTLDPATPVVQPSIYVPISFDFSTDRWIYVIAYAFSHIFAPVFMILSKILKRPTGIQFRRRR